MNFRQKLSRSWGKNNSLLCVGLDPEVSKMSSKFKKSKTLLFDFNREIIDSTADLVCTFKPNSAFYEAHGESGIAQLKQTCDYIRTSHPDIPILLDFKRGDIGNTNQNYAEFAFEFLGVDAVTIQPYMGREANEPFLEYKDKGIFVLCRTSNPSAGELQDLIVEGKKLYQAVAEHVINDWNMNNNCHMVMGAPYPEELAWARRTAGDDMVFLVPGVGAQGGELKAVLDNGLNSEGQGIIINSSRGIIFADDPRQAASKLRDEINKLRKVK